MIETKLRDGLVALAKTYVTARGIALATLGVRATGNSRLFTQLERVGKRGAPSFYVHTADRLVAHIAADWPAGVAWPKGVAKPSPRDVREFYKLHPASKAA